MYANFFNKMSFSGFGNISLFIIFFCHIYIINNSYSFKDSSIFIHNL